MVLYAIVGYLHWRVIMNIMGIHICKDEIMGVIALLPGFFVLTIWVRAKIGI